MALLVVASNQPRCCNPGYVAATPQMDCLRVKRSSLLLVVVWPLEDRNGKWTHNAHPDRTVMDAKAGDVLVQNRTPYRVRAVKVYRSSLCRDETVHPWCR